MNFIAGSMPQIEKKLYFATAADTTYFECALNLISGIQRYHLGFIGEIAVFDLGLTQEEREELNGLAYVKVYEVEKVNPDEFTEFTVDGSGKKARGLYSWKPVVLKQALDLYEEVFYIDAGISILAPFYPLFEKLHDNGFFFIDCAQPIREIITQRVVERLSLQGSAGQRILEEVGISAGFQGVTRSIYQSYILPMYKLAHDIKNFEDDGSAPQGFGSARHDQTLFSIYARKLGFEVYRSLKKRRLPLEIEGKTHYVGIDQFIHFSRHNFNRKEMKKFLKYKPDYKKKKNRPLA